MKISTKIWDITPKGKFYLIGYGNKFESRRNPAEGVHDKIYLNAMLIQVENEYVFICNADVLEFEETFCHEMKDELSKMYHIKKSQILFSATHNHSSVRDYHKTWTTGEYNEEYNQFLRKTIRVAFAELFQNLVEVSMNYSTTVIDGFYGNRIVKEKTGDKEIILVEFKDLNGKFVGGICNLSVHSTVLGPSHAQLSSELAGNIRNILFERLGYYPLMIVGAAAEMSNRHYRIGDDFDELHRVSRGIAQQIHRNLIEKKVSVHRIISKEVKFDIKYDMKELYVSIESQIRLLKEALSFESDENRIKLIHSEIGACQMKLSKNDVDFSLTSSIIALGDLMLISIPGELYSELGVKIKAEFDNCLIFGYTNGHYHYMMPKELYGVSFESQLSLIPKGEVEKYVDLLINEAKGLVL